MMTDFLLAQARMQELELSERKIGQRREWASLQKIDQLEQELRVERTRLYVDTVIESAA